MPSQSDLFLGVAGQRREDILIMCIIVPYLGRLFQGKLYSYEGADTCGKQGLTVSWAAPGGREGCVFYGSLEAGSPLDCFVFLARRRTR